MHPRGLGEGGKGRESRCAGGVKRGAAVPLPGPGTSAGSGHNLSTAGLSWQVALGGQALRWQGCSSRQTAELPSTHPSPGPKYPPALRPLYAPPTVCVPRGEPAAWAGGQGHARTAFPCLPRAGGPVDPRPSEGAPRPGAPASACEQPQPAWGTAAGWGVPARRLPLGLQECIARNKKV